MMFPEFAVIALPHASTWWPTLMHRGCSQTSTQTFSCVLPSKAPRRLPVQKFLLSRPWWIIILQSISWYCNFSLAHQLTKEKPTRDSTSINKHLVSTNVAGIIETRFFPLPGDKSNSSLSLALITLPTTLETISDFLPSCLPIWETNISTVLNETCTPCKVFVDDT